MKEVTLPELGENIETVDVAAVLVSKGDRVEKDQPLIEVETEKASLEVPSPCDGTVTEILVETGDQVRVGQALVRVDAAEATPDSDAPGQADSAVAEPAAAEDAGAPPSAAATATGAVQAGGDPRADVLAFPESRPGGRPEIGPTVPAAPSTRALARELGVNVLDVPGTGPGGRISRDDVKVFAKSLIQGGAAASPAANGPAPLPDFAEWGEIERRPLSAVRRATAANMANAWATVPHVTQFDDADVTELEAMRKEFNRRGDQQAKLTMTAIVVKIAAAALDRCPQFNASLDLARDQVVLKKYVHLGVAVDTELGLLVPVLRDVDRKNLVDVAAELAELAHRARDKKLRPEEMRGACFTVSNLGGLGTTHFSPIVPWPEVAILGVGRAAARAVPHEDSFRSRLVLPLSVSYDHRWIDGADAARFLRWIAEALEQPLLLL